MRAIRRLGPQSVRVSSAKSEAIWFYNWRCKGDRPVFGYKLGGCRGGAPDEISESHHRQSMGAFCGMLPNIGGARVRVRRLYERVVRFRVLYEALVWAGDLMASR